ncbi:fibrinogen-like protein 1-like protein [Gastrophryne carolinensis]
MVEAWIWPLLSLLALVSQSWCALTHVPREKLYDLIANRHVLTDGQIEQLINVPASGVYRELVAKDCQAAYLNGRRRSGLYVLWPKNSPPFAVYCILSSEGAGWTVLQRRSREEGDGFWSRNWDGYKNGFGDLSGSHWLGNELIHRLTSQNAFTVRVLLVDGEGDRRSEDCSSFGVDGEAAGYALRLGDCSGDAGDALTVWNETGIHDNMKFSTADRDNDRLAGNCAQIWRGGWWYHDCQSALLNTDGPVYWGALCDGRNLCRATSIMIKPSNKNCSPAPLPRS